MTTKHKTTTAEPASTAAASTTEPTTASVKATSKTTAATKTTAITPLVTATATGNVHASKVGLQAVYQAMISGLLAFYTPTDTFHMAQGTFTRDELIAEIQSFVSACQSTQVANQSWRSAIQAERSLELTIREIRKGVRGIVLARFGATGAQILQFGFPLQKSRKPTTETKAIAAKKSLATRQVRNTLGPVQKKNLKGNVNVSLVVTPGTAAQGVGAAAATVAPAVDAGAVQAAAQAGAGTVAATVAPVATAGSTSAVGSAPAVGH
jgi:hypothetical protein